MGNELAIHLYEHAIGTTDVSTDDADVSDSNSMSMAVVPKAVRICNIDVRDTQRE